MKPLPTIILNLIVGLPCAYMFMWLFPLMYSAQQILAYTQSTDATLILVVSLGILFMAQYGIISLYCLFIAGYETINLYREYRKEREGYL